MNIDYGWKSSALDHALAEGHREACGCVVVVKGREKYFPCKNIAPTNESIFIMDPDDFSRCSDAGEITAIFHSHPKSPAQPSIADQMGCEQSGVKWWICNPGLNTWCSLEPNGFKAPLIGRSWIWAVSDCWTLARDWYKEELDLDLKDWERPLSAEEFQKKPTFEKSFKDTGFVNRGIQIPEYGDLVLMSLDGSTGLNHCAVYIGDQLILHHLRSRLSSRDVYGGYYQKSTGLIVRHQSRL